MIPLYLSINRSFISILSILGALTNNFNLSNLSLQDIYLDEPCCLQLCNGLAQCNTLKYLNLENCHMGASGSALITSRVRNLSSRLQYLNLNNNSMGPIAAIYIGEALLNENCTIHTIRLANNDLIEDGGSFIAKSLIGNLSGKLYNTYVNIYICTYECDMMHDA